MRRALFAAAFLWTTSLSAQSEAVKTAPDTSTLSRAEKTVLNYLAKDWEKEYRTTSIAVAAEATKVKLSDASRLRLAKFIEANRMSYRAPARHRTTTVALSPTEKLVARSILLLEAEGKEAAQPDEIAKMMNASAPSLRGPLSFLQQFGVILPQAGRGYRLDAKYPRKPSRFIDFFSHHVEVNGREQFEVAWAVDFLLLVNSTHTNDTVDIQDTCAHCTDRIRMKFERGKLANVFPPEAIVFQGGGWGINNLFSSEEHAKKWLTRFPEFADRKRMPVADFLELNKKWSLLDGHPQPFGLSLRVRIPSIASDWRLATFEDGVKGVVDLSRIISLRVTFALLADPSYFARVRVDQDRGTVCWPNGADLDPMSSMGSLVPDADSLTASPMARRLCRANITFA